MPYSEAIGFIAKVALNRKKKCRSKRSPANLNDWIDVGVYGKPAKGKKQGKLLAIRRERIRKKDSTYTFTVKE